MFDSKNEKKELIIVCNENLMEYANYLMALIGQNDDKDEQIVGTKDGTVSAAIWTPKTYKDTLPKITSNTHILFIGSFKEAKEQRKNVNSKFNKYGMHFGWLGKRAVMYIDDKMLKKNEYDQFLEFGKNYQKKFEKATVNIANNPLGAVVLGAEVISSAAISSAAISSAAIFSPIAAGTAGLAFGVYGLISGTIAHKKIKDQQYRCLTMALYLDGLQKFLEG